MQSVDREDHQGGGEDHETVEASEMGGNCIWRNYVLMSKFREMLSRRDYVNLLAASNTLSLHQDSIIQEQTVETQQLLIANIVQIMEHELWGNEDILPSIRKRDYEKRKDAITRTLEDYYFVYERVTGMPYDPTVHDWECLNLTISKHCYGRAQKIRYMACIHLSPYISPSTDSRNDFFRKLRHSLLRLVYKKEKEKKEKEGSKKRKLFKYTVSDVNRRWQPCPCSKVTTVPYPGFQCNIDPDFSVISMFRRRTKIQMYLNFKPMPS